MSSSLASKRQVDFPWWVKHHGFSESNLELARTDRLTALMLAARYGATEILGELLLRGAALQACDVRGNNALWMACLSGNLEAVELLCAAGIDVNNQNHEGVTALMLAASVGDARIVRHLVARGADTGASARGGWTAVDLAKTNEIVGILQQTVPAQTPTRSEPTFMSTNHSSYSTPEAYY